MRQRAVVSGQPAAPAALRELRFSERDFLALRELLLERTGIALSRSKHSMVYARLVRRVRELGLDCFSSYVARLRAGDEAELATFASALSTHVTGFFRELHHFDFLARVLPEIADARRESRRIRIWSAGCSTGEEPYSIAATILSAHPELAHWDLRILATDIDERVLERARRGVYQREALATAPPAARRWFRTGCARETGTLRAGPELRALVSFRRLNLLDSWPMRGSFEAIFCRNVLIYFTRESQVRLYQRFAQQLVPDGYFFVGHSESLVHLRAEFRAAGRTVYRRLG